MIFLDCKKILSALKKAIVRRKNTETRKEEVKQTLANSPHRNKTIEKWEWIVSREDKKIQSRLDKKWQLDVTDIDLQYDDPEDILYKHLMSHHYIEMRDKKFPDTVAWCRAYAIAKKESRTSGNAWEIEYYTP